MNRFSKLNISKLNTSIAQNNPNTTLNFIKSISFCYKFYSATLVTQRRQVIRLDEVLNNQRERYGLSGVVYIVPRQSPTHYKDKVASQSAILKHEKSSIDDGKTWIKDAQIAAAVKACKPDNKDNTTIDTARDHKKVAVKSDSQI